MPIEAESRVRLRRILCARCGRGFCVCQSCWRGQHYCSKECRGAARREARHTTQRRYRRTEKGKKAHREAEKRRRVGLTKKTERIVDYTGSTPQCGYATMPPSPGGSDERQSAEGGNTVITLYRCHFCGSWGIVVDRFPRRGYGKQRHQVTRAGARATG